MKIIHTLTINTIGRNTSKYIYDFGRTRDIELTISENGISISAKLTRLYSKEEMLRGDCYLFPDGIKKGLLLYLLKHSKALDVKSITLKIDEVIEKISFSKETKPPIFSMVSGVLYRQIAKTFFDEPIVEHLLKTPKSVYDKRIAALFALLCSKSKVYETERFLYLWTSFNGMYSWIAEHIARANNVDRYRKENKQLQGLQSFIGAGNETIKEDDKSIIAKNVAAILKNIDVNNASKNGIEVNVVSKDISNVLMKASGERYNLTAYGYLLTQFSYYYRCKFVHGSKPMLLFSYADDSELHCLKIINALLEEFIDENLSLWFDESYVNSVVVPKARSIEIR